jgi:hypothetical protein
VRTKLLTVLAFEIFASLFFLYVDPYVDAAVTCLKVPTSTPNPGAGTIDLGGVTYTVQSHPRMNTNPTRLAALRARSVSGKTLWDQLVINNNGNVTGCTSAAVQLVKLYSWSVGYLSDPTKTTWRDCAVSMFDKIKSLTPATFNNQPDYAAQDTAVFGLIYDYLYDALSAQQRSDFLDWMFNSQLPYIHTWTAVSNAYLLGDTSGKSNCLAGGPFYEPTHNLCITKLFGEYMFALSCAADDARCDALVSYDWSWYNQTPGIKSTIDAVYAGCHSFSGSAYGRLRVIPFLLEMADAETTALGSFAWETWMDSCPQMFVHSALPTFTKTGCPYAGNVCAYYSPEFQPGTITYADGRDLRGFLLPLERDRTTTNNKKAQYWMKHEHTPVVSPYTALGRVNPSTSYGGKEYLPEWHMRWDQDATETNFNTWDTAYLATGLGAVYSRDAWGNNDQFWMNSLAPSMYSDHQSAGNCGTFRLFKNGEFGIVENDTRYAAGNTGLTNAARANILFLGNGTITGGAVTGGLPGYGSESTCTIPWLSQGATYAAWQANLDSAYQDATFPVSYVRRNFVHLKPMSPSVINYVVLMDAASTTASIATKQQIYVPKTSPTVADPDVSFSLTNTKTMIRRIYPTGGTITGNAVTDYSNPVNSGFSASYGSECLQCNSGMNRIDNPDSAANTHFLGVVMSMQGTGGSLAATTAISGASNALKGVTIADTPLRTVLVSATASAVSGTFTFTGHTGTGGEFVIMGLTAGTLYTLSGTAPDFTMTAGSGPITVDANGVARFTN